VTGLVLTLFGPPAASAPGCPPVPLGSKTLGLLAYLALEPGPHSRESLATLLWSDSGDEDARASLRQALRQLRLAFGDAIAADRQFVRLAAPLECDALAFLAAARHDARAAASFDVTRFLSGVTFRQAPRFDEWATATRDRLVRLSIDALRDEARNAVGRSRWRDALEMAERWLVADPLSEEAMGVAIEAEYCMRGRAAALRRYASFRDALRREVGAPPGPDLAELADRIERSPEQLPATAGEAPASVSFRTDLVGRETQWSAMLEAWHAVGRHGLEVIVLEGEAGMGKTRLAEDFIKSALSRGATVLGAAAYEPAAGPAFGAMAAALRGTLAAPGLGGADPEWLAEVSRLLPELRHRFPGLPAPATSPAGMERWRLFEGVSQLLLALAAERRVVLFVDDLQWCDAESCALLQFLVRRLDDAPVLLLATVTSGELESDTPPQRLAQSLSAHPRARRLVLAPLTEDEVWQLIRRMGNIRAPAGGRRFARRLHDVSDGNPFQVIEITKMLFTEGLLGATPVSREWVLPATRASGGFARVDIPRSVRDAIGMRISRLPDELRQLLASIAVAARPVGADVLAHVHGSSRLRVAALAEALMERHLVDDQHGRYRMAHPLLGQAVRSSLSAARLRELHRALSLALEAAASPGRLEARASDIAWHAERGGEPARAYRFALMASDAATAELAFEEASSCLELARRAMPEAAAEIEQRSKALAERAGWSEAPALPAADPNVPPIGEEDLDLRVEGAPH
jgi:DNA-binding SARP family transcriptional activator